MTEELRVRLHDAWADYNQAGRDAFGWSADGGFSTIQIGSVVERNDPKEIEAFIGLLKKWATDMRSLKFVGEQ